MFDKCTGVAVIKENRVLLGLRADRQGWSLAGGKLEDNETLEECAKRELFEEFGLIANKLKYVGQAISKAYVKGTEQVVAPHIFICTDFQGSIKLNEREFKEYQWVTYDELEIINNIFPPSKEALKLVVGD